MTGQTSPASSRIRSNLGAVVGAGAVAVALLWVGALLRHDFDLTFFVQFGERFAAAVQPPGDATVVPGDGYDGQFYWSMAQSPGLGDGAVDTLEAVGQQYRAQRVLYPALAWALALGQRDLVPLTLQLIGWLSMLAVMVLLAVVARRHGISPWVGLGVGLMPGMYLAAVLDLADPLGVALLVAALFALTELDRPVVAAVLAGAGVLTRETMVLVAVAVALTLATAWIGRRVRAPSVVVPRGAALVAGAVLVVYGVWQLYAAWRMGGAPALATDEEQFQLPFAYLPDQLERTADHADRRPILFVLNPLYLAGMAVGALLLARALVQRVDVVAMTGALFAVVALTQSYGDHQSYTRASAPMFACLALVALQRGQRGVLAMLLVGAVLVPLYPV